MRYFEGYYIPSPYMDRIKELCNDTQSNTYFPDIDRFIEELLEKQKEEIKHYIFEMHNNCKSKTYKSMFSKLLLKIEMLSNNPRIEG